MNILDLLPAERIPHWLLHCRHCGALMYLPTEKVSRLSEFPKVIQNGFDAVALAHNDCKHIGTYILNESVAVTRSDDMVAPAEADSHDAVFLGSLRCEEDTCSLPLPLFGIWDLPGPMNERLDDIESWIWDDLRCPKGHTISAIRIPLASNQRRRN